MSDENKMTDLEQYLAYKKVLRRPMFDSIEDARKNLQPNEDEFCSFAIKEPMGVYRVCYAYISIPRDGNPEWAFNEEYTFTIIQMNTVKCRAAMAVGLELVESME